MANKYSEYITIRYFNTNQTLPVQYTDIDGEGSSALLSKTSPFSSPKNIKIGRFTRFADNTGNDDYTWPYNVTSVKYPNSDIWYSYKTRFNDTTSDTQQYKYYYYSDPKWWQIDMSYGSGVTAYLQYRNLDGSYVWESSKTKEYIGNTCDSWGSFTVAPYAERTNDELFYYTKIYVNMRYVKLNTTNKTANIEPETYGYNYYRYTRINPYASSPSVYASHQIKLDDSAFSLSTRVNNFHLSDGRLFVGFTVVCSAQSFSTPQITKIQNSGDSRITTFYNPNAISLTMYYSTKKSKKSTAKSWYENESSNRSYTTIDAYSSKTITIGDQSWYDDKWIHALFMINGANGNRYCATTTTDTSTSNTQSYWKDF